MTPQEIVKEINKLPPMQQKEVIDSFSPNNFISEAEVAEYFLAKGIIKEIPKDWDKPDSDFEPIEIKGKPLSETVIEDRG